MEASTASMRTHGLGAVPQFQPSTTNESSSDSTDQHQSNNKQQHHHNKASPISNMAVMMQQYQDWLLRMMMILEEEAWNSSATGGETGPGAILPTKSQTDEDKLTVVLDVDETLIHAMFLPDSMQLTPELAASINDQYSTAMPTRAKHVFCFSLKGRGVVVRKRPFLDEFLAQASQSFELIAFTAGQEEYATAILDHIDPQKSIFRHRLFRQHCSYEGLVKDLRVLNRNLERTVLVDNSHSSFLFQLGNGIPIEAFVDDMADQALRTLHELLQGLSRAKGDIRHILGNIFRLEARLKADFHTYVQLTHAANAHSNSSSSAAMLAQ